MSICHNIELSNRKIAFLFLLAYIVTWIYSFPLDWFLGLSVVGPKPELEHYTALLKKIDDFSNQTPIYVITTRVIQFLSFNLNYF